MDFSQIIKIENGQLIYSDLETKKSIDLRKSANIWYESFNTESIVDKLLRRKHRNKYAGLKNFSNDGKAYITLYGENEKFVFEMNVNETNRFRQTEIWNKINKQMNDNGFWLLDWN